MGPSLGADPAALSELSGRRLGGVDAGKLWLVRSTNSGFYGGATGHDNNNCPRLPGFACHQQPNLDRNPNSYSEAKFHTHGIANCDQISQTVTNPIFHTDWAPCRRRADALVTRLATRCQQPPDRCGCECLV